MESTEPRPELRRQFDFGANWRDFLAAVDERRIAEARRSLQEMLELESLAGRSFLDVGSGSGLFSLAATQLGAERVHSFDFDPGSVACTRELSRGYGREGAYWTIEQGSVLDGGYMASLGSFDIVYAWGVLHHTGDMLTAMGRAGGAVAPGGRLFISIYNDQGRTSDRWRRVKRTYNSLPRVLRKPFVIAVMVPVELRPALGVVLRQGPRAYVRTWTEYKRSRGMSRWHDWVDWCGGHPFEVASPGVVFQRFREQGLELVKFKPALGPSGCNEFVFARPA